MSDLILQKHFRAQLNLIINEIKRNINEIPGVHIETNTTIKKILE